jgi:hypothetical protein
MTQVPHTDHEKNAIRYKVEEIGKKMMVEDAHGFQDYRGKTISEAAALQLKKPKSENNAAISVIGVVLGANRKWEKVVRPNLDFLRNSEKYKNMTFDELQKLLNEKNYADFKAVWGHRDEIKYNTLKAIVAAICKFATSNPGLNDYELMVLWTRNAKLENRKTDILGSIRNIGIATFQHLRITFGVDTVKPDRRVMEVLRIVFGKKLSPAKSISAVESIASVTGYSVVMIDQIFVKYGSGYIKNGQLR